MGEWVLFDYGGVLCRDQSESDRRALVAASGVMDADRFWAAYWDLRRVYDQGVLTPVEYWTRVVGRELTEEQAEAIETVDVAGWSHPYEETLRLVEKLAATGADLALLSNCPEAMARVVDTLDWAGLVPRRFYSCRLGVAKPDPAVFTAVLTALGAGPGEVTFVDDRPDNVAAAAALGLRAFVFTDPATLAADLDLLGDS
jgi:putative hydrolase of the HAD superfamily